MTEPELPERLRGMPDPKSNPVEKIATTIGFGLQVRSSRERERPLAYCRTICLHKKRSSRRSLSKR